MGLYIDKEIGLYYLQSRYYDPVVGRFLNGDSITYLGHSDSIDGFNPFTYCKNNTIIFYDPNGTFAICLDPGHGGLLDKGAIGYTITKKYYEKDFNLNVANALKALLFKFNISVYMTRYSDCAISLTERTKYANKKNVDLFISIHHNSSNLFKHGFGVYYAGKHDTKISKKLAIAITKGFRKYTLLKQYINPTASSGLAVLKNTKMPAVLVECGYMGGDLTYCRKNPNAIAEAILFGILNYKLLK